MRQELKITIGIYLISAVLFAVNLSLVSIKMPKDGAKPLGNGYSVLSAKSEKLEKNHIVYGFLPYWTLHKAEYFQLDALTDIAYFALRIDSNGTIRTYDDGLIDPGYNKWENDETIDELIRDAKAKNIRFALTIISHEDDVTREFLNCRDCWDTLYNEIVREFDIKGIKHLNMDFELVEPDAEEDLSLKYSQLVNFLNQKLDKKYGNSYVVTSTLPDSMYKPRLTDIESLAKASDSLFVMAYDFHRPTSDNAGPVAPINGAGIHAEYDIATMLEDYLTAAPPSKLILGVPYYGYNWLVYSSEEYSERVPGNDVLGYSISQTYEDIAETRLKYNPQIWWDEYGLVPYFTYYNHEYGTTRQVYFENKESLEIKYNLAIENELAGVGIWALGYDGGFQELWELLYETFVVKENI